MAGLSDSRCIGCPMQGRRRGERDEEACDTHGCAAQSGYARRVVRSVLQDCRLELQGQELILLNRSAGVEASRVLGASMLAP